MKKIKECLKLMRIEHYIKNLLIFLPLIFSGNLLNINSITQIVYAFIVFSIVASIVYIINDINDCESDKKHPQKCKRPIASGEIPVKEAYILVGILLLLIVGIAYFTKCLNLISIILLILYLILNFAYSIKLKHIPICDIAILVSGFLIRVMFGAIIINVPLSNWLYLTVMSMSFYLGLGKRRNEYQSLGENSRKVLKYYSKAFLDKNMYMCLGMTITFYALWCVDQSTIQKLSNEYIIWTVPLVLLICMKYSLNVESGESGDPTDVVLNDKFLISLIVIYGVVTVLIIYGKDIISNIVGIM